MISPASCVIYKTKEKTFVLKKDNKLKKTYVLLSLQHKNISDIPKAIIIK